MKMVTSTAATATIAKEISMDTGAAMSSRMNLIVCSEPLTELKELWKSATMRTLRPVLLYSHMITTRRNIEAIA